jgi:hypothetical protein
VKCSGPWSLLVLDLNEMWCDIEELHLLGYNFMELSEIEPKFLSNLSLTHSGLRSKLSKDTSLNRALSLKSPTTCRYII